MGTRLEGRTSELHRDGAAAHASTHSAPPPILSAQAFFRIAALGPLAGLLLATVIAGPADAGAVGHGGEATWLYPSSLARGLIVATLLALWLFVEVSRRPAAELERLAWRVPLISLALGWLLFFGFVLARGEADTIWSSYGRTGLLRAAVQLAVGYGYVALMLFAARRLRRGGPVVSEHDEGTVG